MSDHLIAEANRHARALIIERDQIRTELALLREWQREVIQNANAHHAERKDAIARAESAEREAFDWKKIARYETARAERAEDNLAALEQCHDDNCRSVVKIADDLTAITAERDQLRAENATLRAATKACEACDEPTAFEVRQMRVRTIKAEANETVALANWNGALERSIKAEADLAALEQCHDDNCRALIRIAEELATERARLDAGTILLTVAGERVWHCGVDLRSAIDAGVKEGAK